MQYHLESAVGLRQQRENYTQQLLERGLREGFESLPQASRILLLQVNPGVETFYLNTTVPYQRRSVKSLFPFLERNQSLFVKVFTGIPENAERERNTHLLLQQHLDYIPKLLYTIHSNDNNQIVHAYEFIEGNTVYEDFTESRNKGKKVRSTLIKQSLDQIHEMGTLLAAENYHIKTPYPWPLKFTTFPGFLEKSDELGFNADYRFIMDKLYQAFSFFPGYYSDRTPRNMLVRRDGKVMQIDFGNINYTSQILDLAKVLRIGTDVMLSPGVDLKSAKWDKTQLDRLATLTDKEERFWIDYFYDKTFGKTPARGKTREEFHELYLYAALHVHIRYLTIFGKILKDKPSGENYERARSRFYFQFGKAYEIVESMGSEGEKLRSWLDRFLEIVTTDSTMELVKN